MQRMGLCIGLKAAVIPTCRELHATVWPEVLAAITKANIRNYSIFLREPENILFAYWEYHGSDFAADAAVMAQDRRYRNGGRSASPCRSRSRLVAKASDGHAWRRSSTMIDKASPRSEIYISALQSGRKLV
jgi:L-rhamnose mutarotase